jgi:hypothetical protein
MIVGNSVIEIRRKTKGEQYPFVYQSVATAYT